MMNLRHPASSARAQQNPALRRIGIISAAGDDQAAQDRLSAFVQELNRPGWAAGRNIQLDERGGAGNVEELRKQAAELIALARDVILASGTAAMQPLLQATRTVPIVFTSLFLLNERVQFTRLHLP